MRLWIDDLRVPPDDNWVWAKSSVEALAYLGASIFPENHITEISFDHDLGGKDTSIKVANELERMVYLGFIPMPVWFIHSANPAGRENLKRALEAAERYANVWREGDPRPLHADETSAYQFPCGAEEDDAAEDHNGDIASGLQPHEVLPVLTPARV